MQAHAHDSDNSSLNDCSLNARSSKCGFKSRIFCFVGDSHARLLHAGLAHSLAHLVKLTLSPSLLRQEQAESSKFIPLKVYISHDVGTE